MDYIRTKRTKSYRSSESSLKKSKKTAIRPPESSQAELFREVSPPEGPFEVFFQLLLKASVDNDENVILSLLSLHITKK
jgi:hypothetical protein